MQTFRTTIRKNRKGNVLKVISEHYLRDDVYCGCHLCETCPQEEANAPLPCRTSDSTMAQLREYLKNKGYSGGLQDDSSLPVIVVPDYSLFSHQMDVLESRLPPFANVVVLQSVLEDARRKHHRTYQRIRGLIKTTDPESAAVSVFSNLHHRSTYVDMADPPLAARLELASRTATEIVAKHTSKNHPGESHLPGYYDGGDGSDLDDSDEEGDNSSDLDIIDDEDPFVTVVDYKDLAAVVQAVDPNAPSSSTSSSLSKSTEVLSRRVRRAAQQELTLLFSAVRWLQRHLQDKVQFVLLTNDPQTAQAAKDERILGLTLHEYIEAIGTDYPSLTDILAKAEENEAARMRGDWVYTPHLTEEQMHIAVTTGQAFKGKFDVNRDYWTEGSVNVSGLGRVLIPDFKSMNRAIDGDIVVIELLPKSEWKAPSRRLAPDADESVDIMGKKKDDDETEIASAAIDSLTAKVDDDYLPTLEEKKKTNPQSPSGSTSSSTMSDNDSSSASSSSTAADPVLPTGRIIGIWTRNTKPFCGTLEDTDKSEGSVFFLPVNKRIPKMRVRSSNLAAFANKRVMVVFDSWPVTSRHPLGHISRELGSAGDIQTETEVILLEHEVKHDPWTTAVKACLPPPDYTISPAEIEGRVDLRDVLIFSIDPPGCTDIDDALHCIPLPDGNFEAGVHIADVSHYVLPGTALDDEARQRSTSVYLTDRRIDMIPTRLSTNICSLRGGVERLAFSVVWKLSPKAEIIETKFFKSIIRSRAAWMYSQAQERIDLPIDHPLATDDMTLACKNLNTLALALKQQRLNKGALTLASAETRFVLDKDNGLPVDVSVYQTKQANSLVEEFMLLANVSVAEHVLRTFPTFALLRRHPTPSPDMLEPLVKAARSQGFDLDISSGRALSDSLDKVQRPGDPNFNKVVRMLTTRCLTQAVYVSSGETAPKNYHHFGLAMPVYTHFTSPIRRYADLVVHRLLATSLGIAPLPKDVRDRATMRDVVDNLNHRHRMAQLASRASSELFTLLLYRGKSVEEKAIVLAVKSTGIRVIVPSAGFELPIRLVPRADTPTNASIAAKFKYCSETISLTCKGVSESDCIIPSHDATDKPRKIKKGDVVEASIKMFDQVQVRISTKENAMKRMWLSVELVGELRDLFDLAMGVEPLSMKEEEEKKKMKEKIVLVEDDENKDEEAGGAMVDDDQPSKENTKEGITKPNKKASKREEKKKVDKDEEEEEEEEVDEAKNNPTGRHAPKKTTTKVSETQKTKDQAKETVAVGKVRKTTASQTSTPGKPSKRARTGE